MEANKLVKLPCLKCAKKLGLRPDQFGRVIRCPACNHSFRATLPSTEDVASSASKQLVPTADLSENDEEVEEQEVESGKKCVRCDARLGFMFGLVSSLCQSCQKAEKEKKREEERRAVLQLVERLATEAREEAIVKKHQEEEAWKQASARHHAEEEIRKQALALELSKPKLTDCSDCGKSVSRRASQCPHCGCPVGDPKSPVVVQQPTPPGNRAFRQQSLHPINDEHNHRGGGLLVAGYICSVLALIIFPPGLGAVGFVCGILTLINGRTGHGLSLIFLSVTCGLIGMFLGAASMLR